MEAFRLGLARKNKEKKKALPYHRQERLQLERIRKGICNTLSGRPGS